MIIAKTTLNVKRKSRRIATRHGNSAASARRPPPHAPLGISSPQSQTLRRNPPQVAKNGPPAWTHRERIRRYRLTGLLLAPAARPGTREFLLAAVAALCYNLLSTSAGVAQRQSGAFVKLRLSVQLRPPAPAKSLADVEISQCLQGYSCFQGSLAQFASLRRNSPEYAARRFLVFVSPKSGSFAGVGFLPAVRAGLDLVGGVCGCGHRPCRRCRN